MIFMKKTDLSNHDSDLVLTATEKDEIILGIRKLKIQAFQRFYNLNKQMKYRCDYRILRDTGKAEDAVADSFCTLWKKGKEISNRVKNYGELTAFLRTVNKNRCFEILRKDRKMQFSDQPEKLRTLTDSPVDSMDEAEKLAIQEALLKLDPFPDRAALICRFYHGMKCREIAIIFGYGESNAASRKAWGDIERAKKALKDFLLKKNVDPTKK